MGMVVVSPKSNNANMSVILLLQIFGLLCSSLTVLEGANILVLTPIGSKSHKIFYMGIVDALAERGHKVTVVSAYKESKEKPNIRDVVIPSEDVTELLTNVFEDGGADSVLQSLFTESSRLCNDGLATKDVQSLKEEKFDIILISMFFQFCYFSLIHHFKVPFIYLSPAGLFGSFHDMIGSIDFPSIAANKVLSETEFPLSFKHRLQTIALNAAFDLGGRFYMIPKMEDMCRTRELCPLDMPNFETFLVNASMVIINSVRALESPPRPAMPNVIYAGGAHIKQGKQLSKDLESWVQGAGEEGFIFFSLGSALNPKNLPERYRKIIMNVFGTLRQRVLWKWEEESMPGQPHNVKLSKWLPQQDILAHKKLKLFITHGGLLSTLESTYNGVPILGLPVFADQHSNVKEAAGEGWARALTWKELNEDSLKSVINEILTNSSLREISMRRSAIMKDVPMHPAVEAAFWVEYVLRHNGAPHLRSPLFQMAWYKVYNIDVWGAIIAIVLIIIYLEIHLMKALIHCCCGTSKGKTKNKKKKE